MLCVNDVHYERRAHVTRVDGRTPGPIIATSIPICALKCPLHVTPIRFKIFKGDSPVTIE